MGNRYEAVQDPLATRVLPPRITSRTFMNPLPAHVRTVLFSSSERPARYNLGTGSWFHQRILAKVMYKRSSAEKPITPLTNSQ
jgi:hypothetical protein